MDNVMFKEKYAIECINNVHYYKESLIHREYNMEKSNPHQLIIGDTILESRSWGHLVELLTNYIITRYNPKKEEMLDLEFDWTKQLVYRTNKTLKAHFGPLDNGLFVNTNHTSTHLLWTIQDLIKMYDINVNECKLLIKKAPGKEVSEVRNHFYNITKNKLRELLTTEFNKEVEYTNRVIYYLEKIDKHFNQLYPSYYSLFLFESKQDYALLKSRFLAKLKKKISNNQTYTKIKSSLDVLTKFYGYMYKIK